MTDQYVFELQFKGKPDGSDYKENQFVIIDGSSMAEFSKLKDDLALCMPEPFTVQYIDEEEDTISIDTEEEFQEFARIARKRCARGMLMRLILNSNLPMDHGQFSQFSAYSKVREMLQTPTNSRNAPQDGRGSQTQRKLDWLKTIIKDELKTEIMNELKEMGPTAQVSVATVNNNNAEAAATSSKDSRRMEEETKDAEYEEDSDGNMFVVYLPEKSSRKTKLMQYQKKLEKKDKIVEAKIDQRLEKLEMKRKKLMEKYSHHKTLARKPAVEPKYHRPIIISAIATKESSQLAKRVSAGKLFTHVWTILNDGTVPLNNVELRHTWSTPGLEPEEVVVKLPQELLPLHEGTVSVRFIAPKSHSGIFVSYWHFFRLVDTHWQQFGHYVSMTGSTKPPKHTPYDFPAKMSEPNKKLKQDQKTVSFMEMDGSVAEGAPKEAEKEEKVLNKESSSNDTLKKQMEQLQATLASSEIAAEMAREAARLLAMASASSEGNTASPSHSALKPSEGDKLNNDCRLEEASLGVQQLNLMDSESDTDANMETNEDSDRSFVIVTMTPSAEQPGGETSPHASDFVKNDGKENKEDNNAVDHSTDSGNTKEAQAQPEPVTFPRLDSNITYPVFPPPPPRVANGSVYLPPSPMIPNNVYNYQVFPPTQNASSHGFVFPPPVNYPQIPAYPPIRTFPPPAVPAVPIPLSTQATFVSHSNQNLPQCPFNPFSARPPTDKVFWTPLYNDAPHQSSTASSTTSTDQPTQTGAQNMNTINSKENSTTSSPSVEVTQAPVQQQPQAPVQRQPQPQQQPLPQQHPPPPSQQPQLAEGIPLTEEQNKNSEPVQILPQALVDGAINVAATAYSTAWNALNNLRPKEGEATEFDPVFENNMATLVEMGFINLDRNARLLKRFNNDISQVIAVICSTGGGQHNLDID